MEQSGPGRQRASAGMELGVGDPDAMTRTSRTAEQRPSNDNEFLPRVVWCGCSRESRIWRRNGAPETIRTSDPCLRRAVLYPSELRARGVNIVSANGSLRGKPGPDAASRNFPVSGGQVQGMARPAGPASSHANGRSACRSAICRYRGCRAIGQTRGSGQRGAHRRMGAPLAPMAPSAAPAPRRAIPSGPSTCP